MLSTETIRSKVQRVSVVSTQTIFVPLEKYCGISKPLWINIIIWTPVLIVLTAFTIKNVVTVTGDFIFKNTAVQIDVMMNETITKPSDMSVCIPYYSRQFEKIADQLALRKNWINGTLNCSSVECNAMKNHSWDLWNRLEFASDPTTIRDDVALAILKKVINDKDGLNALKLERSNFNWKQPIVDVVWHFLSCMSQLDLGLMVNPLEIGGSGCHWFDFNFTEIGRVNNEMLNQLHKAVVDALNVYLDPECQIQEAIGLTFWGDRFCGKLAEESTDGACFIFKPFPDDDFAPPWMSLERSAAFQIFEDSTALYLNLLKEDALYSTNLVNIGSISNEIVSMTYSIDNRVVEGREKEKCSDINTPAACVAEHQLRTAIDNCHCIPFALSYLRGNATDADKPYCNLLASESCAEKLEKEKKDVWTKCKKKCQFVFYKWTQEIDTVKNESGFAFILKLAPRQGPLVQFLLIYKTTSEDYLAAIGGLANLYLGLSGLTVCTILIFCVDFLKRWRRIRTTAERKRSIERWQLFGMKSFIKMLHDRAVAQNNVAHEDAERLRKEMQSLKEDFETKIAQVTQDVETLSKNLLEIKEANLQQTLQMQNLEMQKMKETLAAEIVQIVQQKLGLEGQAMAHKEVGQAEKEGEAVTVVQL